MTPIRLLIADDQEPIRATLTRRPGFTVVGEAPLTASEPSLPPSACAPTSSLWTCAYPASPASRPRAAS
ncbi:hypothetical protein [Nonomuraea typhae]|uniref:hypothetical protein n=1 Tax=Nonomuraea typhae TaxID=2603600 RepID=UPI0015E22BA6|nr:hypothetical protein [Nonomuraea typhae]